MSEENESLMVGLLKKQNALRKKVCACDWTPAGEMKLSGNLIQYISIAQMKKELAPLYAEVGLEIEPNILEPTYIQEARCWLVPLQMTVTDVDTGVSITNTTYGTGEGSKGLAIAISYALKMYLGSKFLLADGIDPDKAGIPASAPSAYIPKTQREKEEVLSRIDRNAVPVEAAVPNPMTQKVAAPKPEEKKEVPAPKAEDAPKKTFSALQGRSIARILSEVEKSKTPEEFAAISAEANALMTPAEARAFITKYKAE